MDPRIQYWQIIKFNTDSAKKVTNLKTQIFYQSYTILNLTQNTKRYIES